MATETAAVFDPTHGWGDSGETGPFVHWLRLAASPVDEAEAGITNRPATNVAALKPTSNR
jgi:hypothetical protein